MNISSLIEKHDKSDYLAYLLNFSKQIEYASGLAIPDSISDFSGINHVAILGMGGSAMGGDFVKSLCSDELSIPVSVIRDYKLPKFLDKNSLIIVSSYSGNTEETVAASKSAISIGAKMIALTTGGEIAEMAESNNIPVVKPPTGYQPRAAVGYSVISIMNILTKTGLLENKTSEIHETIAVIENLNNEFKPDNSTNSEPLKLARKLFGKIPVIYSSPAPFDSISMRWSCQFAENSKVLAFNNTIPEMNHNEIVGWENSESINSNIFAVFLRDENENERVRERFQITREIIENQSAGTYEVWSKGKSKLTRLMSLLYFGDYVSYYLALLNNQDPTTINNIKYLKEKLSKL